MKSKKISQLVLITFCAAFLLTGCGFSVGKENPVSELTGKNSEEIEKTEPNNTELEEPLPSDDNGGEMQKYDFSLGDYGKTTIYLQSGYTMQTVAGTSAFDVYDSTGTAVVHADFLTPENYIAFMEATKPYQESCSSVMIGGKDFMVMDKEATASGLYCCTAYMADKGIDAALYMESADKELFFAFQDFEGQPVSSSIETEQEPATQDAEEPVTEPDVSETMTEDTNVTEVTDAQATSDMTVSTSADLTLPAGYEQTYDCDTFTDFSNGTYDVRFNYGDVDSEVQAFINGTGTTYSGTYVLSALLQQNTGTGSMYVIEAAGDSMKKYFIVGDGLNIMLNRTDGGDMSAEECLDVLQDFFVD